MPGESSFRRIALGMKGAVEGAHMGHADFRLDGRIFATLHASGQWGMVKLTPDQQQECLRDHPGTFAPENGAWGREGCTRVRLDAVDEDTLGAAMTLAWQNASRANDARGARAARPARPARATRKR